MKKYKKNSKTASIIDFTLAVVGIRDRKSVV